MQNFQTLYEQIVKILKWVPKSTLDNIFKYYYFV